MLACKTNLHRCLSAFALPSRQIQLQKDDVHNSAPSRLSCEDAELIRTGSLLKFVRYTYGGTQFDAPAKEDVQAEVEDAVKIASLIERFRHRGHLCANLDPLQRVLRGPWMSEAHSRTGR